MEESIVALKDGIPASETALFGRAWEGPSERYVCCSSLTAEFLDLGSILIHTIRSSFVQPLSGSR